MKCERGTSFVELCVVLAIVVALFSMALPHVRAWSEESDLVAAALEFQSEFRKAWTHAVTNQTGTAIRFETRDGVREYAIYEDGNGNGVLSADIRRGVDKRVAGPFRLDAGRPSVHVAIHAGLPAPPPDSGRLDPSQPIRFGRSQMISFTPLGTATPGTFYLAGDTGAQAAVRVTGTTARVRILVYHAGAWRQR